MRLIEHDIVFKLQTVHLYTCYTEFWDSVHALCEMVNALFFFATGEVLDENLKIKRDLTCYLKFDFNSSL